jgi:hypothetical protein
MIILGGAGSEIVGDAGMIILRAVGMVIISSCEVEESSSSSWVVWRCSPSWELRE